MTVSFCAVLLHASILTHLSPPPFPACGTIMNYYIAANARSPWYMNY